jgi:ABC-2 type transport system permease protein
VLAEEKRQKTDQLLYALPLTMTKVVLGKYFAMLVMLLIPTAIMGIYPLVLSAFGNVYLPASFGALTGFFFLGAALLSIGMFISSITESQAVAAGLCFVVMLLNYYLASLADYVSSSAFASFAAFTMVVILLVIVIRLMTKSGAAALAVGLVLEAALIVWYVVSGSSFEGLFPEIMEKLSLFERFYTFVNGVFDVTSLVYYVTVIGVFLFLSVQSMEKRRWSE